MLIFPAAHAPARPVSASVIADSTCKSCRTGGAAAPHLRPASSAETLPPCASATSRRSGGRGPNRATTGPQRNGRSGRRRVPGRPAAIPGPWSRTRNSPSTSASSTVAPGTPLAGVLEQVPHCALEPFWHRTVVAELGVELHVREPAAGAIDSASRRARRIPRDSASSSSSPYASSSRPVIRSRSRVPHVRGRRRTCCAVPRLEPLLLLQHLDVRLQARQRRAQLVGMRLRRTAAASRSTPRAPQALCGTLFRDVRARRLLSPATRSLGSPVWAIRSAAPVRRRTGTSVARETEPARGAAIRPARRRGGSAEPVEGASDVVGGADELIPHHRGGSGATNSRK